MNCIDPVATHEGSVSLGGFDCHDIKCLFIITFLRVWIYFQ
jgi:hypothetical protein